MKQVDPLDTRLGELITAYGERARAGTDADAATVRKTLVLLQRDRELGAVAPSDQDTNIAEALAELGSRLRAGTELEVVAVRDALSILHRDRQTPTTLIEKLVDQSSYMYRRGAQAYAGFVVARVDEQMEGDLSHRDQQVLYDLRQVLSADIARRYPQFDLDAEATRHT